MIIKKKLNGRKVYLRTLGIMDCNSKYVDWLNDSNVNQFLEVRHQKQTIKKVKIFVKKINNSSDSYLFAICLKKNNLHIGNIKIGPINFYHRYADISYFIGIKHHLSKGYASDAISIIAKFAFKKLKLLNLKASCYSKNVGSKKVLKKNKFKLSGVFKKLVFDNKKKQQDSYNYILSSRFYFSR